MQRKRQIHTVHQNSLATALFGHNVLERLNKHKCIPSHTNTNTHTHRNTHYIENQYTPIKLKAEKIKVAKGKQKTV